MSRPFQRRWFSSSRATGNGSTRRRMALFTTASLPLLTATAFIPSSTSSWTTDRYFHHSWHHNSELWKNMAWTGNRSGTTIWTSRSPSTRTTTTCLQSNRSNKLYDFGSVNTSPQHQHQHQQEKESQQRRFHAESDPSETKRSFRTKADAYFQRYGTMPPPRIMHARLSISENNSNNNDDGAAIDKPKNKILVVGDVHGCLEELKSLYAKAMEETNNSLTHIILVGDLCNKGPDSAKVIRYVRQKCQKKQIPTRRKTAAVSNESNSVPTSIDDTSDCCWYSVRGNHDDGALMAALGDERRRAKKKYQWVKEGEGKNNENDVVDDNNDSDTDTEDDNITLSDADVQWLSELPYTLSIPGSLLPSSSSSSSSEYDKTSKNDDRDGANDDDILIVHAGLIPNQSLDTQEIETMITIREVEPIMDHTDNESIADNDTSIGSYWTGKYKFHHRNKQTMEKVMKAVEWEKSIGGSAGHHVHDGDGSNGSIQEDEDVDENEAVILSWAEIYKGPPRIIFGHDSRRGLQQHEWTTGIDTGAVYGKELTGIILPDNKFISVPSHRVYSPIGDNKE